MPFFQGPKPDKGRKSAYNGYIGGFLTFQNVIDKESRNDE
jgi:hypothetical protein